jgi:death-on-curing family protein
MKSKMLEIKLQNTIIYQAPNGSIELRNDFNEETIWANLDQISLIFNRDKSVISRHIKNIFKDEELKRNSAVAFFATVQKEGNRTVERTIEYFNLDMIISIGYKVNSKVATKFRQWATNTLKQHIVQGYSINKKILKKNHILFQQALSDIQKISQNKLSSDGILELVKMFEKTWFSLSAFDKDKLTSNLQNSKSISLESNKLSQDILKLKKELLSKNEASEIFATERETGNLSGIFANIFQTAFKKNLYPTIESKATHLLYFIVKNHPFIDGNKRSGAFAFIWFLEKSNYNFKSKITPEALTAITLLIAISKPVEKQKIVDLIILLLNEK